MASDIERGKLPCSKEYAAKLDTLKSQINTLSGAAQVCLHLIYVFIISQEEARYAFLTFATKLPAYGTSFFRVQLKLEKKYQFDLAVNVREIFFQNPQTKVYHFIEKSLKFQAKNSIAFIQ